MQALLRSVAVISMKTFLVDRLIFEWSPEDKEDVMVDQHGLNLKNKHKGQPVSVLSLTIDDRGHGKNHPIGVPDDRVSWFIPDEGQILLQVSILMMMKLAMTMDHK